MAFSEKLAKKKLVTNWKKKWSFGRKTIVICLFRNLQHNQSGARCAFQSHRSPRDIRQGSLGPLPLPPHPIWGFYQIFLNCLGPESLLSRNCELLVIYNYSLYIDINLEIIEHTICYSAKLFLFQKTERPVANIGAISFLHVTWRNLTFFNISDKALLIFFNRNP